jgi:hypothetical protein
MTGALMYGSPIPGCDSWIAQKAFRGRRPGCFAIATEAVGDRCVGVLRMRRTSCAIARGGTILASHSVLDPDGHVQHA